MVEANNKGFSKTCYYELLGVDRKAETNTIAKVCCPSLDVPYNLTKFFYFLKAYKKAALKWHPDKNREQDTTEIF